MTSSRDGSGADHVKINLPHVHTVRKRLRDGSVAIYRYHRLTRRRIHGEPGTPEFLESYRQASQALDTRPADGTFAWIVWRFKASEDFRALSERTKSDYLKIIDDLLHEFGDAPFAVLQDRRFRAVALRTRDDRAKRSKRQADYWWSCLRRILSWATDRGMLERNVCKGGGRLYKADRRSKVWTHEHVAAFMAVATQELRLAMLLALYTGQRKGDLLKLTWKAWDGKCISLTQSKTGARVVIPAISALRHALEDTPRRATTILTNTRGRPWTPDGFSTSWGKTARRAGIEGLTFHDLRGTCLTMLAEAGCTETEIAAISGHRIAAGTAMSGYLHHTEQLARSAIEKLEIHLSHGGNPVYISRITH